MLSEHQLRVQASLQKLNIPDWYRQYNDSRGDLRSPTSPAPGQYAQRKRGSSGADGGAGIPPSSSGGHAKWTGLSSKTTSLSSLGGGSQRYDKSALLLLSPSSHSHHGGTTSTGYSRWVGGMRRQQERGRECARWMELSNTNLIAGGPPVTWIRLKHHRAIRRSVVRQGCHGHLSRAAITHRAVGILLYIQQITERI